MKIPHDLSRQHEAWIAGARQQFEKTRSSGASSSSGTTGHAGQEVGLPSLSGYRIVREVKRGGQGVVYEGVQERTGRTVALKLMRGGRFAGKAELLRFEREVHILARLNHRSIVSVLDRGDVGGDQFLVMDFIDGLPLDRFARDHCEDLNARLELFTLVCDAVTAAHQRGVIHRDLKPGNLLVDLSAQPHVLDFGLAIIESDALEAGMTRTGQFVGSLPWASPELALGRHDEVDVRSDVYSLGVILYQLMTDRLPYSTIGGLDSALANIRDATPVPPRELSRETAGDLEIIVLKALAKEPDRRYQSVGELAQDIRRYLRGDAIEARRDSLSYLLRKAMVRHRGVIAASALCILTLAAALAWSTWQWRIARNQRDLAVAATLKEQQARQQADRETVKAGMVSDFLESMLTSADREIQPTRDLTVRQVLDDSAARIDRGAFAGQPQVEANIRMTVGRAYLSLTQFDAAQHHLERARDLFVTLDGPQSENYAESLRWLGILARLRERLDEADAQVTQSLGLFQQLHPGDHPVVGHTIAELALIRELQGRLDESLELTRKAIEMLRRTIGPDHVDVAALESTLAERAHNVKEGVPLARHSLNVLRSARGELHPSVIRGLRRLAGMLFASGDYAAAQESYEEAIRLNRAVAGDADQETLGCVRDLAFLYAQQGHPEKCIELQEQFLTAADRAFGPASIFRISYTIDVADREKHFHRFENAEKFYREVINLCSQSGHDNTVYDSAARVGLVELCLDRGACEEAGRILEQAALAVGKSAESATPASAGRFACLRGELALCRGAFADAEQQLLLGMEYFKKSRLAGGSIRRRGQRTLVRLYEAWDAAEPNSGKAQLAAQWRATAPVTSAPAS